MTRRKKDKKLKDAIKKKKRLERDIIRLQRRVKRTEVRIWILKGGKCKKITDFGEKEE